MKKSDLLKQQRQEILDEARSIMERAKKESREYTDAEQSRLDELKESDDDLEAKIERAEKNEAFEARTAGNNGQRQPKPKPGTPEEREVKNYSILKAVREFSRGGNLTGLELEIHQDAEKEARNAGKTLSGIGVPLSVFGAEKRDVAVTGSTNVITTDNGGWIEALRNGTVLGRAGARMVTGLVGDVIMPVVTGGTSQWEPENDAAAANGANINTGRKMQPKRLATTLNVSKMFLNQTSFGAEQILREDMQMSAAEALDIAGINGPGTNAPTGILNTSNVGLVSIGAAGGALTHDKLVEMETTLGAANGDRGSVYYITTPGVRGKLKTTKVDTGSGIFVWPANANEINGRPALISNNIPSNLSKGGTNNLHAVIMGNFNDLVIGQWGILDLTVDPLTKAVNNQIVLTINAFYDVVLRHPQSFVKIVDVDLTA